MSPRRTFSIQGALRRGLFFAWAAWLLLACASVTPAAQTGTRHEYELKAGVLYHIIEYVQWPKDALPNNNQIQVGLLGEIPYPEAFDVLNGKTVQGRSLVVKRLADPTEAANCQVLFISAAEKARISSIVAGVKDRPILTVSEVDGFVEQGGMVNLNAGPNRIVMEINREVANRAQLNMSSQLLKVAKVFPR